MRRHTEHSSNIVLRHNPLRSELPRLPAVADAKKAPAQRKDGQAGAAGGGGGAHGGVAQPRLGAELLVRLDAFLQQFLEGAYDILMTQVGWVAGGWVEGAPLLARPLSCLVPSFSGSTTDGMACFLPTLFPPSPRFLPFPLQVFREVQPGLNISRLGDADFMHFVRLATYCTRYVRLKEVGGVGLLSGRRHR